MGVRARVRGIVGPGVVPRFGTRVEDDLVAADAFAVAFASVHNLVAGAVTSAMAALACTTRLNPLWIFAAATLASAVGRL
jgi:hypothetical protein